MTLSTSTERLSLPLEETFTISYSSTAVAEMVLVTIDDGTDTGVGAAQPAPLSDHDIDDISRIVEDLLSVVDSLSDPTNLQRAQRLLTERSPDAPGAVSGVMVALADLAGKRLGTPLYRQWGLDPAAAPKTSFTIGLTSPEETTTRTERALAAGHDVLKVKLEGDEAADRERLEAIRSVADDDVRVRVDANGGYDAQTAADVAAWLSSFEVELFEQPVAPDDHDGLSAVTEASSVPVAADESCMGPADVPAVADAVDIVVVKLTKCGGPLQALKQLYTAEAHGLETMLGCMVESNASLAASMQLSPLATYADLDGSLLLAEDPFDGVPFDGGRPALDSLQRNGTGAIRR